MNNFTDVKILQFWYVKINIFHWFAVLKLWMRLFLHAFILNFINNLLIIYSHLFKVVNVSGEGLFSLSKNKWSCI